MCKWLHLSAYSVICGCVMMSVAEQRGEYSSSCFVLQLMVLSFPKLLSFQWIHKIVYYDLSGVLRCVPILALAFACQTLVCPQHSVTVTLSPLLSLSSGVLCHCIMQRIANLSLCCLAVYVYLVGSWWPNSSTGHCF